jgi:hypothetical protein
MEPKPQFSRDLHVLGLPLTFALSQDQTLQLKLRAFNEVAGSHSKRLRNSQFMTAWTHELGSSPAFGAEPRALRFSSTYYSVFRDRPPRPLGPSKRSRERGEAIYAIRPTASRDFFAFVSFSRNASLRRRGAASTARSSTRQQLFRSARAPSANSARHPSLRTLTDPRPAHIIGCDQ